jgi:predicted transport protein
MFFISWDLESAIYSENQARLRELIEQGRPAHVFAYWQSETDFSDVVNMSENLDMNVGIGEGTLDDTYNDISNVVPIGTDWTINDTYNIQETWNMPYYVGMMDPNITFVGVVGGAFIVPPDPSTGQAEFGDLPLEIQVT